MGTKSRAIPAVAAFAAASVMGGPAASGDKAPEPAPTPRLRLVQDDVATGSPTPLSPLHGHDIMGLRAELMGKFPETFAGLYRNKEEGTFTVLETRPAADLEACARECLARAVHDGDTSGYDVATF